MRKVGLALVAVTAALVVTAPANAFSGTCKMVPGWCPAEKTDKDHKRISVPEPATLLILGAGVTAVGAAVARRRKNKVK